MTKLPSAVSLSVLTDQNIADVVNTYVDQLRLGACSDETRAINFINGAVNRYIGIISSHAAQIDHHQSNIEKILQYAFHVSIRAIRNDFREMNQWCGDNNISFDQVYQHPNVIYLFNSADDAVLFKLSWS